MACSCLHACTPYHAASPGLSAVLSHLPALAALAAAQANLVQDQLAALNAQADMTSMISLEHWETVVMNFLTQHEASLFRDDYFTLLRSFRCGTRHTTPRHAQGRATKGSLP